jgi:hypothetical protein
MTPNVLARGSRVRDNQLSASSVRLRSILGEKAIASPAPRARYRDIEDFDDLIGVTVGHDERRNHKFAGAFDLSRSARARKRGELLDAVYNCLSDFSGGVGIILPNVLNSSFKLVGSFGRPPDAPHRSNNRLTRFTTS